MKTTTNYRLKQWEATDKISRADFNSDNATIDAALGAVNTALASKAEQSAVTTVETALANYKTSNDAAVASAAAKANAAYSASNSPFTIVTVDTTNMAVGATVYTFPQQPKFILLQGVYNIALLRPGYSVTVIDHTIAADALEATFHLSGATLLLTARESTNAFKTLHIAAFW